MLPVVPKVPPQDKKLVMVGLTRILFQGQVTVSLANGEIWYDILTRLEIVLILFLGR
jgi:hypothetical protein